MGKYRKKPVVIEAVQVCDDNKKALLAFVKNKARPNFDGTWCVETLEGVMTASPLDFIIKGVKGEIYPCKPDIFQLTYDKVDDNE